ncbi:MAG: hypothetical protein U0V70_00600 [Terriglobia bacterium]
MKSPAKSYRLAGWAVWGIALLTLMLIGAGCSHEPDTSSQSESSSTPASTSAVSSHSAAGGGGPRIGPFSVAIPDGWVEQTPTSSMRKAQFSLPKSEGDPEDAELVAFYFGQGQGGSVEANIDRWIGQISQSDGSSSKDKAKTSTRTVSGMKVTLVDVSGTYTNTMMGNPAPRPGYRMLAAVIETGEGPWFFKLVGPEKTVAKWAGSFDQFINSLKS